VLLGFARCGVCRRPATPNAEELALMRWRDERYLATPFCGSRMAAMLRLDACSVNPKRGQWPGQADGIEPLGSRPKTSYLGQRRI